MYIDTLIVDTFDSYKYSQKLFINNNTFSSSYNIFLDNLISYFFNK